MLVCFTIYLLLKELFSFDSVSCVKLYKYLYAQYLKMCSMQDKVVIIVLYPV